MHTLLTHDRASRSELLADLSVPLGMDVSLTGGGREYAAYPSLERVRWLIPARSPAARQGGMRELFQPRSAKGRVLKAVISSGILRGTRLFLHESPLADLEQNLTRILPDLDQLVFYIGSPGAYRKATALALDSTGATLAFAKIATSGRNLEDIETERRNLLRLSAHANLHGSVPEVIGSLRWSGHGVLVTTAGPITPGPSRISEVHLRFLRDLSSSFAVERNFSESSMWNEISATLKRISPGLPPETASLLGEASGVLHERLGPVSVPLSMAHRDFAPWNTRLGSQGLFVFDWDGAREGVTPLYDLFHFQSIQAALLGGESLPEEAKIASLLSAVWPDGKAHLPWLYLAYLLDIALLYGEARVTAPEAGDSVVWRWFLARIERFLDEGPPL